MPPFQEKEVDKYFEKVADSLNWPKASWVLLLKNWPIESWVLLLKSVLVGKAQEIYGSLSVEQSSNYEHVKEAILKAYELVPEAYRQKFRNVKVNPTSDDVKSCSEDKISHDKESDYMENYKPFISEGVVSLVGDENSSQKVKILRDTGATQSLMSDSVLPLTENSFTGANVLISGVEMGVLEVPLHEVNIKSSLINGNIVIDMRPSLLVEGNSLILGK